MRLLFTFLCLFPLLIPQLSYGQMEDEEQCYHPRNAVFHNPLLASSLPKTLQPTYSTIALAKIYQLEKIDPKHRYGYELQKAFDHFQHLEQQYPWWVWKGKFWEWLDQEGPGSKIVPVRYLDDEEKKRYRYTFHRNRAINPHVHPSPRNVELMFVMDEQGQFFMRKKDRGHQTGKAFHHSSFTAGEPVASAGMMVFNQDGELIEINDLSGHYRPKAMDILKTLNALKDQGVDLQKISIKLQDLDSFKLKHSIPLYKNVSAYYWWYHQRKKGWSQF